MKNIPSQPHVQLFADKAKIAQVIRNLLSNALQFTNKNDTVCATLGIEEKFDIEMALPTEDDKISGFLSPIRRCSFLQSPKTYNESFMVSKYLTIEATDSGVGISSVSETFW